MAMSFTEKQQWVALLEAVTSNNKHCSNITDASLFGNLICRMSSHDSSRMDIMCTWPLSDEVGNSCFLLNNTVIMYVNFSVSSVVSVRA